LGGVSDTREREKAVRKRNFISSLGTFAVLMAAALPAQSGPGNLLLNGDFELGNSSFGSDYAYSPAANTAESEYTVRTNPSPWNVNFVSVADHTDGLGNMFVGNGDPTAGSIVWESVSISVEPNTDYFFEVWAMNVCCVPGYTDPNSPAVLEFSVVGSVTESLGVISTMLPAGSWQFLTTTWNSGSNTSGDLRIINQNTAIGGNDFALDDIHFSTETSAAPVPSLAQPFLSILLLLLAGVGSLGLNIADRRPTNR
jgi:hypothetical protein